MIMDGIAFSSTTHAVIHWWGVVTLNCLVKGFRQGVPSLFFNWPWLALSYSSRGTVVFAVVFVVIVVIFV